MFDHLYIEGAKTRLIAEDIIKWAPYSNKVTFFRDNAKLHIGESKEGSMLILGRVEEFIATVAFVSGLEPVQSTQYSLWKLVDKQ